MTPVFIRVGLIRRLSWLVTRFLLVATGRWRLVLWRCCVVAAWSWLACLSRLVRPTGVSRISKTNWLDARWPLMVILVSTLWSGYCRDKVRYTSPCLSAVIQYFAVTEVTWSPPISLILGVNARNVHTLCPNWSDAKIKIYTNKT